MRYIELTPREIEISKMICKGLTNPQIADKLGIAVGTVKAHIHSIFTKKGCVRRTEFMVKFSEDFVPRRHQ